MDKKKTIKKYIPWVVFALVAVILAVLPTIAKTESNDESKAVVKSTEAAYRDIDTLVIGGGQLESSGVFDLTIPEGVKIKEFLVGNGDTVSEGDPIAIIDRVTVMSAITDVQETIKDLETTMANSNSNSATTYITSKPSGTLKKLYVKTGDSIEDAMLQYGCLAIVSLDNTMAVDIECDSELSAGDKVSVSIGDKQVSGRVKSNISGVISVTVTDNNYKIGQEAKVYTTDDKLVGSGELYVYNAWCATAYTGTVSAVYASEGQSVYQGETLIVVTESGKSTEYQTALDKVHKYEDLMQELFAMYKSGFITAPCDGIVSGVDSTATYMLSWAEENMRDNSLGYQVVLLSEESGSEQSSSSGSEQSSSSGSEQSSSSSSEQSGSSGSEQSSSSGSEQSSGTSSGTNENQPSGSVLVLSTSLNTGTLNQPYEDTLTATLNGQPVSGTWLIEGLPTGLTYDKTTGRISGTPTEECTQKAINITFSDGTNVYATTLYLTISKNGGQPGGGGTGGGGASGGSMGGMSGFAGGDTAMAQEEEDSELEKVTVVTVTSQEEMSLTISVDELDITKLYVGQKAQITMNSFASEPVDAVISNISNAGENSGGNSKFSVKLELDKSSSMLPGMNATATITLDTQKNVLSIPSAAVYSLNDEKVVYTSYDSKKGELTNPVKVEVGLADADYVQIISGINESEKVFYEIYESNDITDMQMA